MFTVRYEYLKVPYDTHLKFYFFFILNSSGQKTSHKTKRHVQRSDGPLCFMCRSISKDKKKEAHFAKYGTFKPITIPTTLTSNRLKSVSNKQRDCHSDYFFFFSFFLFLPILFLWASSLSSGFLLVRGFPRFSLGRLVMRRLHLPAEADGVEEATVAHCAWVAAAGRGEAALRQLGAAGLHRPGCGLRRWGGQFIRQDGDLFGLLHSGGEQRDRA